MAGLGTRRFTWRGRVGLGLILLGLALIGVSLWYYVYSVRAVSSLDRLVTAPTSGSLEGGLPREWLLAQGGGQPVIEEPTDLLPPIDDASAVDLPTSLNIGNAVKPAPDAGSGAASTGATAPRLQWADWSTLAKTLGEAPRVTRIVIPAIDVDHPVVELGIVWDGDKRIWQRAKQSVGHHLGTANPGELGNVVLSGHINSPVRGEGRVFKRLPEIPLRVENGEEVEVFVYTEDKTYVYRVVQNDVVKPDEIRVFAPTAKPTVTLITCVPDLVFSHRLIVTGLLIKVADGGSPSHGQTVDGQVVSPASLVSVK